MPDSAPHILIVDANAGGRARPRLPRHCLRILDSRPKKSKEGRKRRNASRASEMRDRIGSAIRRIERGARALDGGGGPGFPSLTMTSARGTPMADPTPHVLRPTVWQPAGGDRRPPRSLMG